jgi:predicted kinase
VPITGTTQTGLVVLRGNSGSGKSTTARALRRRLGRGTAWVEQDQLRRVLLREHDRPNGVNIGLIDQTVRYTLDHGFHVVLDGILYAAHYRDMLFGLYRDHAGRSSFCYFDIPFEETVRRHASRPQAAEFSVEAMRGWYHERDPLDFVTEQIVPATSSLEQTVDRILTSAGLGPPPIGTSGALV